MERFNASIGFDIRLYDVDIDGSLAQAEALRRAGVLSSDEWAAVALGLEQVREEISNGAYSPGVDAEDVHMAVERRLIEIVGPVGGKIHTGRSRNDQVALDVRMYVMREISALHEGIASLQQVVVDRAGGEIETFVPGYTHLQQGQPLRLAHYLLALFWMLDRDRCRLLDARARMDRMPLGSGALAGSAFPVDREFLCERLGFSAPSENSIDAVTDRDYLAETVFAVAQLVTHLSRYAEDWIVWSSREFGFVELDDAYSTGSSMMPQKKNPDSLELIRGKTGRLYGGLVSLLTVQKGLPLTYGKDLQEDKAPLFDALDTARDCVAAFTGVLSTIEFRRGRMKEALDPNLYATDLADTLVRRGLPFRDAHLIVGELVGTAVERGAGLTDLQWEDFVEASSLFVPDDIARLAPAASADARSLPGGTGRAAVADQLNAAIDRLKERVAQ